MHHRHASLTRRPARCARQGRSAGVGRRQGLEVRRLTVGERYLTQTEAARRAGVSKDSIIRARRGGRLPGARLVDGRWIIPAEALRAAGLTPVDTPDQAAAEDARPQGDALAPVELAAAQAQIAALRELLARQDDELKFLRHLLTDGLAGRRDS